uniref:Conserved oligomeric Golgi complex subunit 1 n=1 Tax=Acrobeloides nanus TaxID=290746 RepID=A0A914D002_9BILA
MCEYFERTEQIIEFVMAINEIFKSDWPTIVSNSTVYQQLFGNALLDRFKTLISIELSSVEKEMLANFAKCNSNPLPLFHKRAAKFDTLSTSSISPELHDIIQKTFDRIKELWSHVNKYVNIGSEENVADLQDSLADAVLEMIQRLVNDEIVVTSKNGYTESDEEALNHVDNSSKWLMRFRLFLALIQHEPSILAQCVSRSATKIERSNKLLHSAAENSLCRFMDFLIDETARDSDLTLMLDFCRQPYRWLDLVQATEKVQLEDAGSIEVPTQLSRHLYMFLHNICRKINLNAIGHLFTRNVTTHITNRLGTILSEILKTCADDCFVTPLVCTQLLFDAKALFLMFPNKQFIEAATILEAKIDPFDLKILSTPLSRNAKLFTQRTYMLFGQLQTETIGSSKDTSLSSSYTALVDIAPKITNIPRLGLIPRLSKLKEEERPLKAKQLSTVQSGQTMGAKSSSTSSFSSFFTDKISSGWFKA